MSDLISRQAAIDVLGVFTQADALGHTPKQIVEALPSAQQWIPVSERLPSDGYGIYMVTAKSKRNGNNFVRILHYNGEKYGWEEQSTCTVLAWANLPEPWKGEEDE